MNRPGTTTDISGSQIGIGNTVEKFASKGLGEEFELAHFVGTVNAGLALSRELLKQLPAKSCLAGSRRRADDVKTGTEKLKLVEIIEAGETF